MEHSLQNSYTLSVRPSGKKNRQKNENVSYEDSIRKVGTFSTVEQFWNIYSHMPRPGGDTLGRGMDFHRIFYDYLVLSSSRSLALLPVRARRVPGTFVYTNFVYPGIPGTVLV